MIPNQSRTRSSARAPAAKHASTNARMIEMTQLGDRPNWPNRPRPGKKPVTSGRAFVVTIGVTSDTLATPCSTSVIVDCSGGDGGGSPASRFASAAAASVDCGGGGGDGGGGGGGSPNASQRPADTAMSRSASAAAAAISAATAARWAAICSGCTSGGTSGCASGCTSGGAMTSTAWTNVILPKDSACGRVGGEPNCNG